MNQVLNRY